MPKLIFYPNNTKSVQSISFGKGHAFTPANHREYKKLIRLQAIQQLKGFKPIARPVHILHFGLYFQRPLNHYVGNNRYKPLKSNAEILCMKTPDYMDNAFKGIGDALNGLAWLDDKQICKSSGGGKYWTEDPDHIILIFEEVSDGE